MELTIKQWMGLKEISVRELAEKSGVSEATICHMRTGKHKPSLETLKRITEALEINLADVKV